MHRYRITTHDWLPGVALSLEGGWGGLRYPTDEAAAEAAAISARPDRFTIERQTVRRRIQLLGDTDPAWLVAAE